MATNSLPAPGSSKALQPTTTSEPGPPETTQRPLDIVFLQDATGSQGPYIKSAREAISMICTKVTESAALSQGAIRFGLISFRDHPPQDKSYVTKNFGFTADPEVMKKNLGSLIASGGGDGPEASTAALADALNLEYAQDAVKIVVLITDAPPHGLGENGDGFPDGSPDQNDPLDIARQMAEHGITLYVIACEPSLSRYKHAVDFYRALTQITSGRIVPLTNAAHLGDYIVGSALESLEAEHLISQFEQTILEDVYGQGKSIEEVMQNIQDELQKRKVKTNQLHVEEMYEYSAEAEESTDVWRVAASLRSARGQIKEVAGTHLDSASPISAHGRGGRFVEVTSPASPTGATRGSFTTRSMVAEAECMEESEETDSDSDSELVWSSSEDSDSGRGRGAVRSAGRASTTMMPPPGPPPLTGGAPVTRAWTFPGSHGGTQSISTRESAAPPSPPAPSYAPQDANRNQARRLVMQGLMRNAKVGPGGVLQPTGAYADKGPTSIDKSVYGSASGK